MRALSDGTVRALAEPTIQQFLLYDAVDAGPALVFVADEQMQYLAVNQTACDLLGYSREELLELRVTDIVADTNAAEAYDTMLQQRTASGEATLRTKDGSLFTLSYNASEVRVAGLPYYVSVGFASQE